jgi:hypothetical protein
LGVGLQEGKTTSLVNFTSGTFAAIAATLLTQPTDMIRTQMQLGNAKNAGLGSVAMLRKIVASKGAGVLLAGAAPRVRNGYTKQLILSEPLIFLHVPALI